MAKVLLVEDDNNLREIYQARLTAEGYEIVAAQNGEEALVLAKQNKPDLVISDVMMPRISGFEMLDILRNTDELKNTKVIMLTALGQAEDQTRADNLGADKYLVKSQVTLEDIVNAAKELLGESAPAPVATAAPDPEPVAEETPPTASMAASPVVPDPSSQTPAEPVVAPVSEPANPVPASVVPQADTTVVVPPAPANPTPPTVTVVPLPPTDTPADETTAAATDTTDNSVISPTVGSSPASTSSQSLEAEEAALQSQIESFANQPTPTPPVAAPISDAEAEASNDEAIANAVEELSTSTDEVATPAIIPDPTEAQSAPVADPEPVGPGQQDPAAESEPAAAPAAPAAAVSIGGTRTIQPLSSNLSSSGPNLDELLAKEEAKEGTPPAAPVINGTPTSAPPETPPANPGQSFDPNSVSL